MQIRWFAGAAQAAGVESEEAPQGPTGSVREVLAALHPEAADVLARCSFLVDGKTLRGDDEWPSGAQLVDVLPPFSGG